MNPRINNLNIAKFKSIIIVIFRNYILKIEYLNFINNLMDFNINNLDLQIKISNF